MGDKEAIGVLMDLMKKHKLSKKEKEAVLSAIGILSWSKLGKIRLENIARARKAEREDAFKDRPRFRDGD